MPYCSANDAEKKEEDQQGLSIMQCPIVLHFVQRMTILLIAKWINTFSGVKKGFTDELAGENRTTKKPGEKKDMFAGVLFNKENNWHNKTAAAFEEESPISDNNYGT